MPGAVVGHMCLQAKQSLSDVQLFTVLSKVGVCPQQVSQLTEIRGFVLISHMTRALDVLLHVKCECFGFYGN